jgi:hypothetical protein
MDFVTGLPKCEGYDAILVVVDRLSKMALYIPTKTTINAEGLARVFMDHVYSKHGLPKSIVTDRGSPFDSKWWREFNNLLGTKTWFSTSYHPRTDGQTERVNQELESYLRFYVTYLQNDWVPYLPMAEFARNNSIHSSIGTTPFYANKGFNPTFDISVPQEVSSSPSAQTRADNMRKVHDTMKERMKLAQEKMAKYFDKRHLTPPDFKVGDKVFLVGRNISTMRPAAKLDAKNYGPYPIKEKISDWAYRLELPDTMRVHDVFHVDLLEPSPDPSAITGRTTDPPGPVDTKIDLKEYEVEAITSSDWIPTKRGRAPRLEYLVQWHGYKGREDEFTWEPKDAVTSAEELLEQYHRRQPSAPGGPEEPESLVGKQRHNKSRRRRKR